MRPLAHVTGRADSHIAAVGFKMDRFPPDRVRVLSIRKRGQVDNSRQLAMGSGRADDVWSSVVPSVW